MADDREAKNKTVFGPSGPAASDPNIPKQNVFQDVFGLDIPVETIPLPSKGLTYAADSKLKRAVVDIKGMTAKEEDILTSPALLKKGTVQTALLQSCILEPVGVDTREMLSGDRNTLMIALRITGYGSEYTAEITCGNCNNKEHAKFDLNAMPLKSLDVEPCEPNSNLFEFTLPLTKKRVRFKLMTGKDEEDMRTETAARKKAGLPSNSAITSKLKYSLVAAEGKTGWVTEKHLLNMLVDKLPAKDSLALRNYMDDIEPGIEMKGNYTCSECGETSRVDIPLGPSFFWPDR